MRVLLTGHRGYLGSVLLPQLMAAGHRVQGLDSDLYRECRLEPLTPCPEQHKDVRDVEPRDLAGCEGLIHLAGLSNDPLGDLNPELTDQINAQASLRLFACAREAGVRRLVFASTCSLYGGADGAWADESTPPSPLTPYARSKARVEEALRTGAGNGLEWTCLRLATVYGPSPTLRFDLVLNNLVAYALSHGEVLLKSDGQAWRPLLHVEDAARAFLAALEAPAACGASQSFNVGSSLENYQVATLAELVQAAVPGTALRSVPEPCHDHRSYRVDCGAIARELGYQPRWTAADGARQLAERYRGRGIGPKQFEGERYSRVAHLQSLQRRGLLDAELRWVPR